MAAPDKKQVATALTTVVKRSALAGAIDPSKFFMQIMTNYAALAQRGVFDLVAIYEPMAPKYPAAPLAELFRELGEELERLGFEAKLPDLSRDTDPPEPVEVPQAPVKRTSLSAGGALSSAETGVVNNLIAAMRASPKAAQLVSAPQLNYFLSSHIKQLFDGTRFDFRPVYEALVAIEGLGEDEIYLGFARFRRWLSKSGTPLIEPPWRIDTTAREKLDELAAQRAPEHAMKLHSLPAAAPAPSELPPLPAPGETREEAELRKLGLGKKESTWLRPVLMATVGLILVVVAAAASYATNPIRDVEAAEFQAVFPLTGTFLFEGAWMGLLDEPAWRKLDRPKREKALAELTELLKTRGRLRGARILKPDSKLVVGYDVDKRGMQMDEAFMTDPAPKKP